MNNNVEKLRNEMLKAIFDKDNKLKLSFDPKDDKYGYVGTTPKGAKYTVLAIATADKDKSNPNYLTFHTDPIKGDYNILTKSGIDSSRKSKIVQIYRCKGPYRALNDQYDRLTVKAKKVGMDPLIKRSKSIFVQSVLNSGEYKPGDIAELIDPTKCVSLNNLKFIKKPENIEVYIKSKNMTKSLKEWGNELHIDIDTLVTIYARNGYDGVAMFIEEQFIPRYQNLGVYIPVE